MKWTTEQNKKYKANPFNQLAAQSPIIFFLMASSVAVASYTLLTDLGNWTGAHIIKYIIAVFASTSAFVGICWRLKKIRKEEANKPSEVRSQHRDCFLGLSFDWKRGPPLMPQVATSY